MSDNENISTGAFDAGAFAEKMRLLMTAVDHDTRENILIAAVDAVVEAFASLTPDKQYLANALAASALSMSWQGQEYRLPDQGENHLILMGAAHVSAMAATTLASRSEDQERLKLEFRAIETVAGAAKAMLFARSATHPEGQA